MRPTIRRQVLAGATVCILLLSSAGCVQVFDARTLGAKTSLSARATDQPQGEPFKITKTAVFAFWGIAAASRPSLDRVLATQVSGESEVANLRITQRSRFSDILVTVLTGGVVVPRSITYEGVVVKPPAGSTPQ